MKAIGIIPGTRQLDLLDVEQPQIINRDDVLIKVDQIGISAIDRRIAAGEPCEAPPSSAYLILGHEMRGHVVDMGSTVKDIKPGDCVVLTVRHGCGQCVQCIRGNPDVCLTGLYRERGIRRLNGCMTEYVVEREENVITIPSDITDIAVLLEPLSLGEKAVDGIVSVGHLMDGPKPWPEHAYHYSDWGHGRTAIVVGGTAVAVLAAFILRFNSVTTYLMAHKPEGGTLASLIEEIGATYIEYGTLPIWQLVNQVGRVDIIIEATGATELDFELVELLGHSGVFAITSTPAIGSTVTGDMNTFVRERVVRSQILFGSIGANRRHFEQGVEHLRSFKQGFGSTINKVVTHRYPFLDFEAAFSARDPELIKALLVT